MTNDTIEDQLWKLISKYRALKMVFLVVVAIGICSSAIRTISPAAEYIYKIVSRAVNTSPPHDLKQKFGCAYIVGRLRWDVMTRLAPKQLENQGVENSTILYWRGSIEECKIAHRFPIVDTGYAAWPAIELTTKKDVDQIRSELDSSISLFAVHLMVQSPEAYSFYSLGVLSGSVEEQTRWELDINRKDESKAVAQLQYFVREAHRLEEYWRLAQSNFMYKLPSFSIDKSSIQTIHDSISEGHRQLFNYMLKR